MNDKELIEAKVLTYSQIDKEFKNYHKKFKNSYASRCQYYHAGAKMALKHAKQQLKDLNHKYNLQVKRVNELKAELNIKDSNEWISDVKYLEQLHDKLEVDWNELPETERDKFSDIVKMCQAIADDYWMYKAE